MRTIKALLEYDGLKYHGWQIQKNAISIQEVFENSVGKITGTKSNVAASGRTDAGVHARGQVVSFTTEYVIEDWKFQKALNALLPPDIVVTRLDSVENDFHARFSAKGKVYIYTVLNRDCPSAFEHKRSWHVVPLIGLEEMKEGAKYLVGENDFSSFRSSSCCARNPVRVVKSISICKERDTISFLIEGNGFLKQMVRNIVGTLVDVGLGRRRSGEIETILRKKDRRAAGPTAPARGLCLYKVIY